MRENPSAPRVIRLALALATVATLGLGAPAASAGGPTGDAARKNAARHLADEAAAAYEAGRYDEAIATFQKADETYHAPTLGVALARAYARAGRLLEARAALQKVLAEKLPPGASDAFRGAQAAARAELTELEPAIASIQVRVVAGAGHRLAVAIDGQPLPEASLDAVIPQNPGPHVVEVRVDGRPRRRRVDLARGEHGHVDLDLTVHRGGVAPAVFAFTVGGAALLAGIITGVDTVVRSSSIKALCPGGHCPSSEEPAVASARSLAGVSTGLCVFAGAAAAAGIALYVIRPGGDATPRAGLSLGPGSLKLSGVF